MTASRFSVELIITSFLFGLSQGLQLEDGTHSSTLQRIINWPSSGLGGLGEHNMEQYDLLFMSKGVKDEVLGKLLMPFVFFADKRTLRA